MAMTPMPKLFELLDSGTLVHDGSALRARAARDGYLFLRAMLPLPSVQRMRDVLLEVIDRHGWLDPAYDREQARSRPGLNPVIEGEGARWDSFYRDLYRRRELHQLNHHARLMAFFTELFDEPVLAHPRVIARVMFPNSSRHTTPPHQDAFYIGGTTNTWTAWIPLGDCPGELGGLAVAAGSHTLGRLAVRDAHGAGGHAVELEEPSWHSTNYAAGDVLVFHSHTVHQARDNQSEHRLRLSLDLRYQPLAQPVARDSLLPHRATAEFGWREVYRDWQPEDPLRAYWERLPIGVGR
jgi:hypothetical protein